MENEVLREVHMTYNADPSVTRHLSMFADRIELGGKDGDKSIGEHVLYSADMAGNPVGEVMGAVVKALTANDLYTLDSDESFSIKAYEDAEK